MLMNNLYLTGVRRGGFLLVTFPLFVGREEPLPKR